MPARAAVRLCSVAEGIGYDPPRGRTLDENWSRRRFLRGSALVALSAVVTARSIQSRAAYATPTPLGIVPRSEWGGDLKPKGGMDAEDARFLLVHHTQDPGSGYAQGQIPKVLRSIYDFHTGTTKKWPDVAYNFFVDKFGGIWEGRTGSLAGPVEGSATGGNQGYSQLCCFLGDFSTEPPPDVARAAMVSLLAWLANRYAIDTGPAANVTFTSRGSNRYPPGHTITTNTIAGHRDMSQTECPGDACYPYVVGDFRTLVTQRRTQADVAAAATGKPEAAPAAAAAPPESEPPAPEATADAVPAAAAPAPEVDQTRGYEEVAAPAAVDSGHGSAAGTPIVAVAGGAAGVAVATAAVAAAVAVRRRHREAGAFEDEMGAASAGVREGGD